MEKQFTAFLKAPSGRGHKPGRRHGFARVARLADREASPRQGAEAIAKQGSRARPSIRSIQPDAQSIHPSEKELLKARLIFTLIFAAPPRPASLDHAATLP